MRTKQRARYHRPKTFDRAVWNCLDQPRTRFQIVDLLYEQGIDTSYAQVWRSCERLAFYGHAYQYNTGLDEKWLWARVGPPITR